MPDDSAPPVSLLELNGADPADGDGIVRTASAIHVVKVTLVDVSDQLTPALAFENAVDVTGSAGAALMPNGFIQTGTKDSVVLLEAGSEGETTIRIRANQTWDQSGNPNQASEPLRIVYDRSHGAQEDFGNPTTSIEALDKYTNSAIIIVRGISMLYGLVVCEGQASIFSSWTKPIALMWTHLRRLQCIQAL